MWTKFGDDMSKRSWVMLDKTDRLTDRQTDRQTDKPTNEHTCQNCKFWQVTKPRYRWWHETPPQLDRLIFHHSQTLENCIFFVVVNLLPGTDRHTDTDRHTNTYKHTHTEKNTLKTLNPPTELNIPGSRWPPETHHNLIHLPCVNFDPSWKIHKSHWYVFEKHRVQTDKPTTVDSQTIIPSVHDDVIKWRHFPRYWPFVAEIHWP